MADRDDKALNEDALAEAYNRALAFEKAGDFDAAAKAYEEVLAIDPDDHGGAAVRLASMGRGAVPPKAPDAYVATLFDQHAELFDTILVDQLGYDVPLQLREMLLEMDEKFHAARMLDLGCGTGLSADALDDMAAHKTGVDISENMIEVAFDKGDYDRLFVGEAVHFLETTQEPNWDLIVATDVLPYMGELDRFFAGVAAHLDAAAFRLFQRNAGRHAAGGPRLHGRQPSALCPCAILRPRHARHARHGLPALRRHHGAQRTRRAGSRPSLHSPPPLNGEDDDKADEALTAPPKAIDLIRNAAIHLYP